MPQATTLAIEDGAATPVTHTFTPVRQLAATGEMVFSNQSATKLANRETLSVRVRDVVGSNPAKVAIKLQAPVEATVDGVVVKTQDNLLGFDFVVSPESSADERKARRILFANLLLHPEVAIVIDNVEAFY